MRRLLLALVGSSALLGVLVTAALAADWPQLQGGPERRGAAPDAPSPPYRVAWDTEAGESGHRGAAGPVISGALAYAVGREEVVALRAGTGEIVWTVARAPSLPVVPAVADDEGLLVYPEGSGDAAALVALDLETRQVRWRFDPDEEIRAAPAIANGTVYAATRAGTVLALDAATGAPQWSFDADGIVRSPVAASDDGVVVTAVDTESFEMTVHSIEAGTGEESWRFSPDRPGVFVSGALLVNDRVYVGFGDGSVRAFDAGDGSLRWASRVDIGTTGMDVPAALEGDVVALTRRGNLVRLDGETGVRRWRFQFPAGFVHGPPLVVGGQVVAGRADGTAVAVDAETGLRTWQLALGGGSIGALAPAGDLILAGLVHAEGGIVALEHDPEGTLTAIESPSVLHADRAVVSFGIAFAAVLAGIGLGARLVHRGGGAPGAGPPGSDGSDGWGGTGRNGGREGASAAEPANEGPAEGAGPVGGYR